MSAKDLQLLVYNYVSKKDGDNDCICRQQLKPFLDKVSSIEYKTYKTEAKKGRRLLELLKIDNKEDAILISKYMDEFYKVVPDGVELFFTGLEEVYCVGHDEDRIQLTKYEKKIRRLNPPPRKNCILCYNYH